MNFTLLFELIFLGIVTGLIGTVIMTISQYTEMWFRGRASSVTPGRSVAKIFGINFEDWEFSKQLRFSNTVHWVYGTLWGVPLIFLSFFGSITSVFSNSILYFLIIWIQGLIILPVLKIAPVPWKWKKSDIFFDAFHHAIYGVIVAAAYFYLMLFFI